ncbi:MAG: hypothetical protein LRS49_04495 [Desulfurococcales archaeon]|nr:hypothetical protein [Desulfurococcales archaeon]
MGRPLRKLVLLSGTAGVSIDAVLDLVRGSIARSPPPEAGRVGVAKFEDFITGRLLAHITSVLRYFIESRPSAIEHFHEALAALEGVVERSGFDTLYLAAHLSYMVEGHLIPNPVLSRLLDLAEEVTIIYYVEDFYDALDRIRRHSEAVKDYLAYFNLDPLSYLEWRGLDFNLLGLLENLRPGVEALIFGVKHPRVTHERLLRYAALPGLLARRRFHLAYFSHPITFFREAYVASRAGGAGRPLALGGMRGVRVLERLKDVLRSMVPTLILFEPTTVDELILESPEEVARAAGCGPCEGGEPMLSPVVTSENRWPLPPEPLHGDYAYAGGGRLDLVGEGFMEFFGVESWRGIRQAFCPKGCLPENAGGCPEMVASRIQRLIDRQIKLRDYEYVAQSSLLIAATIVYIERQRGGPWVAWLVRSQGMEAEIRRAQALGRPVYLVVGVVPVEGDPAAAELDAARSHALQCPLPEEVSRLEEAERLAPQECLNTLERAGPFSARPNLVNLHLTPPEEFARSLASLAERGSAL